MTYSGDPSQRFVLHSQQQPITIFSLNVFDSQKSAPESVNDGKHGRGCKNFVGLLWLIVLCSDIVHGWFRVSEESNDFCPRAPSTNTSNYRGFHLYSKFGTWRGATTCSSAGSCNSEISARVKSHQMMVPLEVDVSTFFATWIHLMGFLLPVRRNSADLVVALCSNSAAYVVNVVEIYNPFTGFQSIK